MNDLPVDTEVLLHILRFDRIERIDQILDNRTTSLKRAIKPRILRELQRRQRCNDPNP